MTRKTNMLENDQLDKYSHAFETAGNKITLQKSKIKYVDSKDCDGLNE